MSKLERLVDRRNRKAQKLAELRIRVWEMQKELDALEAAALTEQSRVGATIEYSADGWAVRY